MVEVTKKSVAPGDGGAGSARSEAGDPNFARLTGADDYGRYFHLLARSFTLLLKCYRLRESEDSYETRQLQAYLDRLLFTVSVLRMKYSHHPQERRPLWVDLTDSGLPNAQELAALETSLAAREERLRDLPTGALLRQLMLDHMFRDRTEPEALLHQMAERSHLEALDADRLFLPFNAVRRDLEISPGEQDGVRHYRCSWACYDFASNRPYLHIMTFDQDAKAQPLEEGRSHDELLAVLKAEGSRAPDVGILAMALDEALDTIHPKILKRICLGPLHSRLLLAHDDLGPLDEKHRALDELLHGIGGDDDFVLFLTDEIVFSKRQEVSRSLFSPQGKVREVFMIPEVDPECYTRRASVVHKYALLPHRLVQHMDAELSTRVPELRGARILTYDRSGEVHGF